VSPSSTGGSTGSGSLINANAPVSASGAHGS
jgi:hypothetical protein